MTRDRWDYKLVQSRFGAPPGGRPPTISVVGCEPDCKPYLRIETVDGQVLWIDNRGTLKKLARAIQKALRIS